MAITKEERTSTNALVDEANEALEIAKRLHAVLRRPGSVARMRAIRVNELGQPITEPPPAPDPIKNGPGNGT